jgi:predicted GTPase
MVDNGGDPFDRELVSDKQCSLENLVYTLEPAYKLLEPYKGRSLILCFGTTGCGKSTMLNSVLYGSNTLQKTSLVEEVVMRNGEKRQNTRTVIDVVE